MARRNRTRRKRTQPDANVASSSQEASSSSGKTQMENEPGGSNTEVSHSGETEKVLDVEVMARRNRTRRKRTQPDANVASSSQEASSSSGKTQMENEPGGSNTEVSHSGETEAQQSLHTPGQSNENPTKDIKENPLHSSTPLPMNDVSGQQNNALRVDKGTQTNIKLSEPTSQEILEMDSIVKDLHSHYIDVKTVCIEIKKDLEDRVSSSIQHRKRPAEEAGPSQISDANQPTSDPNMVPIGYGKAVVHKKVLDNIEWSVYTIATRRLLLAVFPRSVLATHSLTGQQSPAFPDRPLKKILDPELVEDILRTVSVKCEVTRNVVRNCISHTCSQEAYMYRKRQMQKEKPKNPKIFKKKSPSPSLPSDSSDYDDHDDDDNGGDDDGDVDGDDDGNDIDI